MKIKHSKERKKMSDTEATRESLPSISDLSINPQTPPITKTPSTDGKPKKEAAEKGWSWYCDAI